jgi:protein SCO1/2
VIARRAIPLLLALVALEAAVACGDREAPLPEMITIADFALTDQDGEAFGTEQLRGKVWIADMIFTSCPDVCPVLSSQMANLHRHIDRPEVRFVSISVDPRVDTPEVLRTYAGRYRADTTRWSFLTGEPELVHDVIERRLMLPVEEPYERSDGTRNVLHSPRFILVDRDLKMRGLYETDREGLDRLEHDVERLLAEGT